MGNTLCTIHTSAMLPPVPGTDKPIDLSISGLRGDTSPLPIASCIEMRFDADSESAIDCGVDRGCDDGVCYFVLVPGPN